MVIRYLKLSLIGLTALLTACDTLKVNNSNGAVGLLVDGGPNINDRGRVKDGIGRVAFDVGRVDFAAFPSRNEAISFGYDRAPSRSDMPWNNGTGDVFNMSLGDELAIPITVWIVQGPFATQRDKVDEAVATTESIWDAERMGIRFSDVQVIDATSDPDIDDALLNSVGGNNRNWSDYANDIGFINGRINVYWINTVEASTTVGWSDAGSQIVMGANSGDELLIHEIGHSLSLQHPSVCHLGGGLTDLELDPTLNPGADPNFDATNIMWPCSSSRQFVSEGQVFRAHFNSNSSINNLYGVRPGDPLVSCESAIESAECPILSRRLWDDGPFPAN